MKERWGCREKPWMLLLLAMKRPPREKTSHCDGPGFKPGSGHVGFCGGQSGAGAGFLRVLRFPLPVFIPPIAPKIIIIYHLGFVQ
jgi:hypothetical protein